MIWLISYDSALFQYSIKAAFDKIFKYSRYIWRHILVFIKIIELFVIYGLLEIKEQFMIILPRFYILNRNRFLAQSMVQKMLGIRQKRRALDMSRSQSWVDGEFEFHECV